ncbi:hypothetical protein L6164_008195 [Bauhinia variegata]|uniref:Uncharacterized protein n=1 Tax=Bauhinia variegata TaxID=167791 RepID=A0ACB9PHF5_BAUVA|nr:hypothetical protein L6164_008195 [Bauhinia variegata]
MAEGVVHVGLLPNAGMGHLTPFLRLAALLLKHNCKVTLITPQPTVSLAESELISRFHSQFPQVTRIDFHLLPFDATSANSTDPIFLRFESVRRSAHSLSPLLDSISPPLSALVFDLTLISPIIPVIETLSLPSFILFTSSARMFSFFSYFPSFANVSDHNHDSLVIPGIPPVPRSSIPPLLRDPNSIFARMFTEDSGKLRKFNGILINTFAGLEAESLEALRERKVSKELPPVFAIGPFEPCEFERLKKENSTSKWLDDQPQGSVVFVSFGSRTAMRREQIREIGDGLLRSGCKFLWVVKDKPIDREEKEGLEQVVGHELMDKLKEKGLVVKTWVDQNEILGHGAVGGFVCHCGWNSVIEAALNGVKILAWPQHGDQKINAEVVEMGGLGMWVKDWGRGEKDLVKGEEIGKAIRQMMNNESPKISLFKIQEAARKALGVGGNCQIMFQRLIEEWKKKDV